MPAVRKRESDLVDQRPAALERRGGEVSRGELMPVTVPEADSSWHPVAKRMWESFAKSGQQFWWQQSDWAKAYWAVSALSRFEREEEAHEKGLALAVEWDELAGSLSAEDRVEMGFAPKRPLVPKAASPQKMETIDRMLGSLLATELDRRRAHIELEAPVVEGAGDPVLDVIQGYAEGLRG